MSLGSGCQFLPPYLLEHVAESAPPEGLAANSDAAAVRCAEAAAATLAHDAELRQLRESAAAITGPGVGAGPQAAGGAPWGVYTARNGTSLPGTLVRDADQPNSGDAAVDEAAYGGQATLDLFEEVYQRASFDGAGARVVMTVHYGRNYDNAFWNGTQLVFGDGDGQIFDRFTKPVDVLGHELTHAVTEHTAGLTYRNQSGALNESISDVFACCVKQRLLGQSVDQADWLIGVGLFLPGVSARALRDMANPGTAYDDPRLGKDPQVGHMDDYVQTSDDNGGVHLNSGIPNRAFYLAATGIGGSSWDGAGAIWYAALTSASVGPATDFAGFAAATIAAAGEHADAVTRAWADVGVSPTGRVEVRRSGGFTGITTSGAVDLAGDDPVASRARALVARLDTDALGTAAGAHRAPQPDRFTYTFCVPGRSDVTIGEPDLTDDLRSLARLVLGDEEEGRG